MHNMNGFITGLQAQSAAFFELFPARHDRQYFRLYRFIARLQLLGAFGVIAENCAIGQMRRDIGWRAIANRK